jgi:Arc/MetJ family transcription regulator
MVLNMPLVSGSIDMRSTINLDDTLLERARSLTGTKETAALVRQALETLVRVESGKRLIALGGSMPEAEAAPRRRSDGAT